MSEHLKEQPMRLEIEEDEAGETAQRTERVIGEFEDLIALSDEKQLNDLARRLEELLQGAKEKIASAKEDRGVQPGVEQETPREETRRMSVDKISVDSGKVKVGAIVTVHDAKANQIPGPWEVVSLEPENPEGKRFWVTVKKQSKGIV